MLHFDARQMVRNNADHPALGRQHGVGNLGHQADAAGAIYQGDAARRDFSAKHAGEGGVARILALVGAAIDAQRFDPFHAPVIQCASAER